MVGVCMRRLGKRSTVRAPVQLLARPYPIIPVPVPQGIWWTLRWRALVRPRCKTPSPETFKLFRLCVHVPVLWLFTCVGADERTLVAANP